MSNEVKRLYFVDVKKVIRNTDLKPLRPYITEYLLDNLFNMTTEKLKIWKVYESDHTLANQIGSRGETQADVFYNLIHEFDIQKLIRQNYSVAATLYEEGLRTGKHTLLGKAAGQALTTLKEIRTILQTRNIEGIRMVTYDEDELLATIEELTAIGKLFDEDKPEPDKKEVDRRLDAVLHYFEETLGMPFTQWDKQGNRIR